MGIPQSPFGRTSRMLLSGAKMFGQELTGRLGGDESMLKQRVKQAQELVTLLGQLKGAALKGGQIFSQEFADVLPKEVVAVLSQLQDKTAFMPFDQVRYIITKQLGAQKLADLVDLTVEPIAAASIGQVHKAKLHGADVVIKVQYPGVAKSIDSDLASLKKIALVALQLKGQKVDVDPLFDELVLNLKKECNYYLEAEAIDRYKAVITDPRFVIPSVYRDYSAEQVLTLSFEEGERISDWMSSSPPLEERAFVAEALGDLVIEEFLRHGLIQTDPNFGNFLYRSKEHRVVLLDFGATLDLNPELRRLFGQVVVLASEGQMPKALQMIEDAGILSGKESPEAKEMLLEAANLFARVSQPQYQPFQFGNAEWQKQTRILTAKLSYALKHTPPPKQILLQMRKLAGVINLLRDLGVAIDVTPKIQWLKTLDK